MVLDSNIRNVEGIQKGEGDQDKECRGNSEKGRDTGKGRRGMGGVRVEGRL